MAVNPDETHPGPALVVCNLLRCVSGLVGVLAGAVPLRWTGHQVHCRARNGIWRERERDGVGASAGRVGDDVPPGGEEDVRTLVCGEGFEHVDDVGCSLGAWVGVLLGGWGGGWGWGDG